MKNGQGIIKTTKAQVKADIYSLRSPVHIGKSAKIEKINI